MAHSLSSLLLPHSQSTPTPFLSLNPNPHFTHRHQSLNLSIKTSSSFSSNNNKITYLLSSPLEKKSFAVATGEIILRIVLRLLKISSGNKDGSFSSSGVSLFEKSNGKRSGNVDYEERIGAVIEDEIELEVIWEQRVKDIEAKKERRVVMSLGFSFSAIGLLFPYWGCSIAH